MLIQIKVCPNVLLNIFKIKKLTIKLVNSSTNEFYDFANTVNSDISATGMTNGSWTAFHSHVDDPRQNLHC